MKSWVKLYTEINRDADMGTLTWAQRGIWSALLALAGEIDDRGVDGAETGAIDRLDRIGWHLRLSADELSDAVEAFMARGMVDLREEVLYVTNYQKRQARPPSQRPEAQRDRQREHRASQPCHNHVTTMSRGVTPSDADADSESDTEADVEAEASAAPEIAQKRTATTAPAASSDLGRLLSAHGIVVSSSVQVDMWRDMYQDAGPELFQQALTEATATAAGIPKPKYVDRIIKRCQKERLAPGQWHDPPARASPPHAAIPEAPTTFRNPISGEVETV